MSAPLRIQLSWPARELSPNKSVHWSVLRRFKAAAKKEAWAATLLEMDMRWQPEKEPVPIHLIAHPKPDGPQPDADNFIASCKAFFDGISHALGINDRDFDAPTVEWAERCAHGKLIVVVG